MILQKAHVLGKSFSQVIYENALNQSNCKIFYVLILQRLVNVRVVIENTLDQSDCIFFFLILISRKPFEVESLLFTCNKISTEAAI